MRRHAALPLALLLSALACKGAPAADAAPPAELAATQQAKAPTVSWATFTNTNSLETCVDAFFTAKMGGAEEAEKFVARTIANAGTWQGRPLGMRLAKSCAQQFPDRVALATCITGVPEEGIIYRAYDIGTFDDSDAYAKECLTIGGDWRPNPEAIEAERRRDSMRRLRRIAGN